MRPCRRYESLKYYDNLFSHLSQLYGNLLRQTAFGLLFLYTLYHATATTFGDDLICFEISVHILYLKHRSVFTSWIWYKQRIVRGVLQSNRFDWLIAVTNRIQVG